MSGRLGFIAVIIPVVLSLLGSGYSQSSSFAILHDNLNCLGPSVNLTAEKVANLNGKNFNERTESVTVRGSWMFYEQENYNSVGYYYMNWVYSPTATCVNLDSPIRNKTSSVRYAGSSSNIKASTITFYNRTYFEGTEDAFFGDNPNPTLTPNTASFIMTGATNWTVYDQRNYGAGGGGSSWCIVPPRYNNSTEVYPAFVEDTARQGGIPHGTIRSFKRGCSLNAKVVYLSPLTQSKTNVYFGTNYDKNQLVSP